MREPRDHRLRRKLSSDMTDVGAQICLGQPVADRDDTPELSAILKIAQPIAVGLACARAGLDRSIRAATAGFEGIATRARGVPGSKINRGPLLQRHADGHGMTKAGHIVSVPSAG